MTMDSDGDVDMLAGASKQCFTPIQNRKILSPSMPSACSLCPSMDLIVLAIGDTLWIHRTVSWQRLATWKQDDCAVRHACWSPDGRSLALALTDGRVVLHHVEALSSEEETGEVHSILLPHAVSLVWAHVGRPHPSWTLSEEERERQDTWRYQSRYLDRASTFLPPSSYHIHEEGGEPATNVATTSRPSCQTPLSLLCAATSEQKIHLYLHGRYEIATLACPGLPRSMVCSSELTKILVQSGPSLLTLYSLPALAEYRYPLQIISALYCSMTCHLQAIQQHAKEVVGAWKSSLKPLDTKLDSLTRLLKNYGVSKDVRSVLQQYILVGSAHDEATSSALDQFFSNVQMNDQLLVRLERSLYGAVANVETSARKGLLSPARSLAYEAGELQSDLLSHHVELQQASHDLVLAVEGLIARIVQARFRLRDLMSWLRSAGSQVKARDTAPNSAQRENAKKRRVPQALVERLAGYLREDTPKGDSVTESLLGISVTEFLSHDLDYVAAQGRPLSPKSVKALEFGSSMPTVTFAASRTDEMMYSVFEQPRQFVSQSITSKDITIHPTSEESAPACAIHTRIGCDHVIDAENDVNQERGDFFFPRLAVGEEALSRCRNWTVIARAEDYHGSHDSIHIFALPLGWKATVSSDEELEEFDDEQNCQVPFYLSARLVLPAEYTVKEITFYADDGKSSLSAGTDSGTGQEGRQAIGVLVSCPEKREGTTELSEELWLIRYDSLLFSHVALPPEVAADAPIEIRTRNMADECITRVQSLHDGQDEVVDDPTVIFAKTRRVSCQPTGTSSQLLLSGSRGVGGVLIASSGHIEVDIFDLEEDESASDDEEDE